MRKQLPNVISIMLRRQLYTEHSLSTVHIILCGYLGFLSKLHFINTNTFIALAGPIPIPVPQLYGWEVITFCAMKQVKRDCR